MATQFEYKAITADGISRTGHYTAETKQHVTDYIEENNLIPVTIKEVKPKAGLKFFNLFKKVDFEDLIMFTNNLSTMYRAGIPLLKALSIIKIGKENGLLNLAIPKLLSSVQAGKSLSQAMREHREVFSEVYINAIEAGEESGKLDDILDELSEMLEKELEITRLIKSGLRYPIIVFIVIALAFTIVMTFVVPKFIDFYAAFDAELPIPTQIMIGMSQFFTNYWWALIFGTGALIYGFKSLISNPKGKLFVDTNILKVPLFGQLIIKGNVARFSLMFRILFKSGLPIIKSLSILTNSVKNSMISQEINKLEQLFARGSEHELINTEFHFFPDLAKQMYSIGLESGSLEKMLHEVGSHYSKEVQYTSRHLTSILEPVLTLIISGFVLLMALAIFLPMWNLIKVFGS